MIIEILIGVSALSGAYGIYKYLKPKATAVVQSLDADATAVKAEVAKVETTVSTAVTDVKAEVTQVETKL